MAADQGHGEAQNDLGTLYYGGKGVGRDLVEAWKWFTLSLDRLGGPERKYALRNRDALQKEMSREQLAEAKRRVAAWQPMRSSEERRVGKECVSTCRSRGSPSH